MQPTKLNACEPHKQEDLLPKLLQHKNSLATLEYVIVKYDTRSSFIAGIKLIQLRKPVGMKVEQQFDYPMRHFTHLLVLQKYVVDFYCSSLVHTAQSFILGVTTPF